MAKKMSRPRDHALLRRKALAGIRNACQSLLTCPPDLLANRLIAIGGAEAMVVLLGICTSAELKSAHDAVIDSLTRGEARRG